MKRRQIGDLITFWPHEFKDICTGIIVSKSSKAEIFFDVFSNGEIYERIPSLNLCEIDEIPVRFFLGLFERDLSNKIQKAIDQQILSDLMKHVTP